MGSAHYSAFQLDDVQLVQVLGNFERFLAVNQFPNKVLTIIENSFLKVGERIEVSKLLSAVSGELSALHFRLRALNALLFFLPRFSFNRVRTRLYRAFGLKIGARTIVMGSMELAGGGDIFGNLSIGEDCQITSPLYLDLNERIVIGERVAIGHHVRIITTSHEMQHEGKRCGAAKLGAVHLEDGCWVAAGATVLPGVTIGKGSVVAAGSVVAKNVPPNTLVGGVPAKVIKQLEVEGLA